MNADINYILFLVAVLNLGGDLLSIYRFRDRLPRWIPVLALSAAFICGLAWFLIPDRAGFIAAAALCVYLVSVKLYSRSRSGPRNISAPTTKALVVIHLLAYAVQHFRSPKGTIGEMVAMGAFYSPFVAQGEWWRVITAQFVHFGFLHVACNMFGVWFLAPLIENVLGRVKLLLCYFASGAGGLLIAAAEYYLSGESEFLLAGASAGVMGLVGVQGALALRAYRRSGSIAAKAQLSAVGQVVVLQMLFDAMVPQVSSVAHLGGAFVGFLLGWALNRR